ncbi:hypothetical protein TNCV_3041901 [Trichonephila clavipes]|nr:hypothetical protein TNCV_3041901 [Trichonephila clavipes]
MRYLIAYACPVWGYAAITNIKILDTAQNSFIHAISIPSRRRTIATPLVSPRLNQWPLCFCAECKTPLSPGPTSQNAIYRIEDCVTVQMPKKEHPFNEGGIDVIVFE